MRPHRHGLHVWLYGSSCLLPAKEAEGISIRAWLANPSVAVANYRMTATTCPSWLGKSGVRGPCLRDSKAPQPETHMCT